MTTIKSDSPVVRETGINYRGKPIIVELHPGYMLLRQKKRRASIAVDYVAIMDLGYKLLHRKQVAEREAARKERRKERYGK